MSALLAVPQHESIPAIAPSPAGAVDFVAFIEDAVTTTLVSRGVGDLWPRARIEQGGVDAALAMLAAAAPPRVLLVDVSASTAPVEGMRNLSEIVRRGTAVLLLGTVNDVALYRDLIAAGAADYLIKPISQEALYAALRHVTYLTAENSPAPDSTAVAVIGARGGVGATTLAVSVGWILAQERKKRVALVDLDLHFGSVALTLDLEPTAGLREAALDSSRIDSLLLASGLVQPCERLSVLASEEPLEDPLSANADTVTRIAAELAQNFDIVVFDMPREMAVREPAALAALGHVMLVTDLSLAALRDSIRLVGVLKRAAPNARIHLIANRVGAARKGELRRAEFERGLGRKLDILLPEDSAAVALAANTGQPLGKVAGQSRLVQGIRAALAPLGAKMAAPAQEKSWLKWIKDALQK